MTKPEGEGDIAAERLYGSAELIDEITAWSQEETSRAAERYRDRLIRHQDCLIQDA